MAENQSSSGLALMARAGRAVSRWSVGTAVAVGLAPVALAGPTGETVVIGDVTFTREGNNVYITASDGSVIQYDSFNLSMDEIVTFFQPGSDARVYNQILSSMPSIIDGSIFANGIVYFVNPAGVIFGPSAVINVGGIYAAAANLSHADFIAGRDAFTNAQGAVVNRGSIVGSRIHMLGAQVQNHGSIRADGGLVMMAAGQDFLISEDGSGVMVHVDGRNAALGPSAGATTPGVGSQAGVLNTGWIDASGGSAILAAGDLYALGIHNLGTVTASGGSVQVTANDGLVLNDGTLDVSADGDAGSVIVRGPSVMNRGVVRADSEHGQAGYAEVTSHDYTLLLGESVVSAAGGSGNAQGGEVLIHSYEGYSELGDDALLDISGGDLGGDAGFVEFSGHWMNMYGTIDLGAAPGYDHGTLLLDPYNLDIVLAADINNNNKFTPNSPFDAQNGDLTIGVGEGKVNDGTTNEISVEEILALDGNIILEARNDMRLLADLIFAPGPDTSLEMRAGNDIVISGNIGGLVALLLKADYNFQTLNSNGVGDVIWDQNIAVTDIGALTIEGVNVTLDQLDLTLSGGTLDIDAAGDVSLLAQMGFATAGVLTVNADGNITLGSGVTNATSVLLTADHDLNGVGDVVVPFNGDLVFGGAFGASGANIIVNDSVTSITAEGLSLVGNLTTGALGTFTLDAGSGVLSLGDLTATAADSVVLGGASLNATGSIAADVGTLEIQTSGTVGGSISSAGDFLADGDLAVTGSVGSGGAITGTGDLLAGGAMLAGGAIDITGAAEAGADITAGTTLDIGGALTLSGGGAQSVEAGGQATFGGQVTKATGDLSFEAGLGGAGVLDFNSGVEATTGTLSLLSDATLAGNLRSGASLTLGSGITLDGLGDQTISSGDVLTVSQATNKATGGLTLEGETGVDVDAAITLTNGAFSSTGGYFDNTGFAISANSITLTHDAGVTIGGELTAVTLIDLHAGNDGTGDLDVGAVAIEGNSIALRAGNGLGGGALSTVNLNIGTTFAAAGGATGPDSFTFQQDASIDTALDGPTAAMVAGGAFGTAYTLDSGDGSVTIADGSLASGTDFTVNAGTGISLNAAINVNSFTASSGGLTSIAGQVDAAQAIALNGASNVTSAMTAGTTMTFGGNAAVNAAVSATDAMTFQGTANVLVGLSTDGSLTFQDAATIASNLASGGAVTFQSGAVFSGALDQAVSGTSVALVGGASKASGSLSLNTATATIGDQVIVTLGNFIASGDVTTTDDITAGGQVSVNGSLAATSGSQVTVSGTSVAVGGETSATSGGLQVQSASFSTGGLSSTGGGDIALTGNGIVNGLINLTGGMNVAGTLDLNGAAASVATADGLTVGGDMNRNGGDLAVTGALTLGGNLTGVGAITLNGPVVFSNGGSSQFVSANGALTLNGTVLKANQRLDLIGATIGGTSTSVEATNGQLVFTGTTTLTNANVLAGDFAAFLDAASVASVRAVNGFIFAQSDLTTTGLIDAASSVEVDGVLTAGQNVNAGGGLLTFNNASIAGNVTGSSIDAFGAMQIGGNVTLTGGMNVAADVSLGGNVTADSILLQGGVTLTGNGTQTLASVNGSQFGAISKAQGNLAITASGLSFFTGDIVLGGGSLSISGPAELGSSVGLVQASGAVSFLDALFVDSSTTFASTGGQDLRFFGAVANNGNPGVVLTLNTTGDTVFGSSVNAAQLITDAGGRTLLAGPVTTTGQQNYQDRVVLTAASSLTSTGGGSLTLAQGVEGAFGLSTSTSGTTAMGAGVDVGSWQTGALGNTTLGSDVTTTGDLLIANILNLTGTVTFDGQNVSLTGGVNGGGQGLTIKSGGVTDLRGAVALGSLTTDTSGSFQLGADLTTDSGVSIGETDVLLVGNSSIRDADANGLEIDNSFSGPFALLIGSAGDLTVSGGTYTQITDLAFQSAADILMQAQLGTALSRLGSLSLRSGDLALDPQDPGVIRLDHGGAAFDIFTTGDVAFNGTGHAFVPQVSTIGSTGDLTIDSTGGNFTMGQNEKLTVLGVLDVNLPGLGSVATVSDITSLGDMIITASKINIRRRVGGILLAENPNVPGLIEAGEDPDTGVDFVTGGSFVWSVKPGVIGTGESPRFGSPGAAGDANNVLFSFVQQDFGDLNDAGLLSFDNGTPGDASDDVFFDLASSGPTLTSVSEALAGALPRDTEVQEVPAETPLSMTELRLLRELSIYAQRPDPEEYLSNARIGVALYDDNDTLFAEIPEVTVNRLLNDRVREVLDGFRDLVYMSDDEAAAAGTNDRRVLVREQLTEARLEFALAASQGGESTPEAFYGFMAQGQYAGAVEFLGRLSELLTSVANLGLTDREFRTARRLTLEQIKPDNIPLDELERLLELSRTAVEAPVIEPVGEPEVDLGSISLRD